MSVRSSLRRGEPVFLTIDGPNGVGKTTICRELGARLTARGVPVALVREPSESAVGSFARSQEHQLVGLPLAVLVVADRYLQVETEIKPALSAGVMVVCDRYVASTLVLQRIDGIDLALLWEMNASALEPDLSVLLSASPTTLYERLGQRGRISRFDRLDGVAELEVQYFRDAAEVLRGAGYRVLPIDTDHVPIAQVADQIERQMALAN